METLSRSNRPSRPARRRPVGKKRQACESCRSLKARCSFDPRDLSQCTNCRDFKRRCFVEDDHRYPKYLRPSESSRPLSEGLCPPEQSNHQIQADSLRHDNGPGLDDRDSFGAYFPFLFSNKALEDSTSAAPKNNSVSADLIDRGLLDIETASTAFTFYVSKMACRLPLVPFPPNISSAQCRLATPVLFLSIVAVGIGSHESSLQHTLLDEFYKVIADQVVYQGQKRIELVQALLVTWMWMPPPERLEDMKVGMLAHLIASMVEDWSIKSGKADESATNDGRRTLLGSYVACAMLSLVRRRPNLLPFTEFVSRSLAAVRDSSEALPSDRLLVAWVELEHIATDLADAKSAMPNPTPSSLESLKRSFESRLFSWKDSIRLDIIQDVALLMEYHTTMLHMNLLSVSDGRTPLAPPFTEDMISPKVPITDLPALRQCVGSAHAVLDSFLRLSPEEIPVVPGIVFPRTFHALLILIVAALAFLGPSHTGLTTDGAQDITGLEIHQYFDRVLWVLGKSPSSENERARKIIKLLTLLRTWHTRVIIRDHKDMQLSDVPAVISQDSDRSSNGLRVQSRDMTNIDILQASIDSRPENSPASSPPYEIQQPGPSSQTTMPEPDDLFPLREDQYAFFASLVERPDGPPWTLFDDAMGVFDFM